MSYVRSQPDHRSGTFRAFLMRLHFYVGLFVGPFVFIAALTGFLYVITPQIETQLYTESLTTQSQGAAQSLAKQAQAAREALGQDLAISAMRPATAQGLTTRVMFSDPSLGESENRTIFVDPVTLKTQGELITYGTSSSLPFRTTLDYLHRNLMLGDWGRYYSELAASWLLILAAGGIALWASGPRRRRAVKEMPPPQRRRWIHGTMGAILSLGLLMTAVTGMTWSQAAGARIDSLRSSLGWITPSISTSLEAAPDPAQDPHAHHHGAQAEPIKATAPALGAREDRLDQLDAVAAAARAAGLDAAKLEIRLPKPNQAWSVTEYDRSWPSQVDSIALDPATLKVTSRAEFAQFTLIPKLIRWGIDLHMGVLFGLINQIIMAVLALGLCAVIAYGYLIWWQRRPVAAQVPLITTWSQMSAIARGLSLLGGIALGWLMPTLGVSLVGFVIIDLIRARLQRA